MSAGFTILDSISAPGSPERANEDAFGHVSGRAGAYAWVIDGATGLADTPLLEAPSDAAWLAHTGSALIGELAADHVGPLEALLRAAIEEVALRFEREKIRDIAARYEIPSAALFLMRTNGRDIEWINFGDCILHLRDGRGFRDAGSDRAREQHEIAGAAKLKAERLARGLAGPPDYRLANERLRAIRNLQNRPDGYWVFGLAPEAAAHARTGRLTVEGPATGLVMSDGFSALSKDYRRHAGAGLVEQARRQGLEPLIAELRQIEREEDPHAMHYPRYKQSDDATALLIELPA